MVPRCHQNLRPRRSYRASDPSCYSIIFSKAMALGNFIQNQFRALKITFPQAEKFKLLLFCDLNAVFNIAWIRTNRVPHWNLLLLQP